ncbi:MAG: hypothetical protein WA814_03670 [Candidatus Baltobacteraceae bacterium]
MSIFFAFVLAFLSHGPPPADTPGGPIVFNAPPAAVAVIVEV